MWGFIFIPIACLCLYYIETVENKEVDYEFIFGCGILVPQLSILVCMDTKIERYLSEKRISNPHIMFPNNTDNQGSDRITIQMPVADTSVQERIYAWQKAGYRPYVVVHKNAFRIQVTEKEMEEFRAAWDPIICVDIVHNKQKFTVIIDQYGDEPAEKALMEKLATEHFRNASAKHLMEFYNLN
jgi:hypothetical protein